MFKVDGRISILGDNQGETFIEPPVTPIPMKEHPGGTHFRFGIVVTLQHQAEEGRVDGVQRGCVARGQQVFSVWVERGGFGSLVSRI